LSLELGERELVAVESVNKQPAEENEMLHFEYYLRNMFVEERLNYAAVLGLNKIVKFC